MIAYCGLTCDTCPIHLATTEPDRDRRREMRESVVRQCAELYHMDLRLEEVTDCDGCRSETGRLFPGCRECGIRNCAIGKNLESCASCSSYPCGLLREHFAQDPGSRTRLDRLRSETE
jgi:hypothetical protein